jgi:hypothetical protein
MKKAARVLGAFVVLVSAFALWYTVAADYSDSAISGTYRFSQIGVASSLVLNPDHTFHQMLNRSGTTEDVKGTWRRVGEGGIDFSKEFLVIPEQEPNPHGESFGDIHKDFGLLISINLRQYQIEDYSKVDPSADSALSGTYAGKGEGVEARLFLKPDHTFEQWVGPPDVEKHAQGSWKLSPNGDIAFSNAFLKASGQQLTEDETATCSHTEGSTYLQIEIDMTSKSGSPSFRKRQIPFYW